MLLALLLPLLLLLPPGIDANIVVENELIDTKEIFDLESARDSSVYAWDNNGLNVSKYYCVFRNNWSADNHPSKYPELTRWSNPVLFSHTKQYAPFLKNKAAPYGVETIAEVRPTALDKILL